MTELEKKQEKKIKELQKKINYKLLIYLESLEQRKANAYKELIGYFDSIEETMKHIRIQEKSIVDFQTMIDETRRKLGI